jgi:hypothetical protein
MEQEIVGFYLYRRPLQCNCQLLVNLSLADDLGGDSSTAFSGY